MRFCSRRSACRLSRIILKSRSLSSLLRAGIRLILHVASRIDNRADLPRIKKVDAFDNNKITAEQGSDRMLPRISPGLARDADHFAGRGEHTTDLFSAIEQTRRSRLRSFR